jgi:hypothetical protein
MRRPIRRRSRIDSRAETQMRWNYTGVIAGLGPATPITLHGRAP